MRTACLSHSFPKPRLRENSTAFTSFQKDPSLVEHWEVQSSVELHILNNNKKRWSQPYSYSSFTRWPYKLLMVDKHLPTTQPPHNIKLIFPEFSRAGAENSNDYDSCCCQLRKKRQSHPLFIMQHLVAPLHSGLFSDTVTEKIRILCSCEMDFSLHAKWQDLKLFSLYAHTRSQHNHWSMF